MGNEDLIWSIRATCNRAIGKDLSFDAAIKSIRAKLEEGQKPSTNNERVEICPDCSCGLEYVTCSHGIIKILCCRCQGTGKLSPVS